MQDVQTKDIERGQLAKMVCSNWQCRATGQYTDVDVKAKNSRSFEIPLELSWYSKTTALHNMQ